MSATDIRERVAQRVLRARIRLALAQPFLASALMRLPVREAPDTSWCPTAATDGYHLFYNSAWFARLPSAQIRGVLAHEVLHVLFAHADRRGTREARRWNIACDHAINLLLQEQGFSLPEGGMLDARWRGMTAEQVYGQLPELPAGGRGKRKGTASANAQDGEGEDGEDPDDCQAGQVPGIGTDLLEPEDPRLRPLRAPDAPDAEQLKELRRELREAAQAALQGKVAGLFKDECAADDARRIDWRAVLRAFLHDRIKGDWQCYPFSKRHLHRGLFMPSPGLSVPGHVVFAIDTSGSMQPEVLAQIHGELCAFRETFPCRLTVLQADARVQSVRTFEAMDGSELPRRMTIHGRGGTDFRPVFEWVARQPDVSVVIYATDGWGSFPKRVPEVPVIWMAVGTGVRGGEVPFGHRIYILARDERSAYTDPPIIPLTLIPFTPVWEGQWQVNTA